MLARVTRPMRQMVLAGSAAAIAYFMMQEGWRILTFPFPERQCGSTNVTGEPVVLSAELKYSGVLLFVRDARCQPSLSFADSRRWLVNRLPCEESMGAYGASSEGSVTALGVLATESRLTPVLWHTPVGSSTRIPIELGVSRRADAHGAEYLDAAETGIGSPGNFSPQEECGGVYWHVGRPGGRFDVSLPTLPPNSIPVVYELGPDDARISSPGVGAVIAIFGLLLGGAVVVCVLSLGRRLRGGRCEDSHCS